MSTAFHYNLVVPRVGPATAARFKVGQNSEIEKLEQRRVRLRFRHELSGENLKARNQRRESERSESGSLGDSETEGEGWVSELRLSDHWPTRGVVGF
eukprot:2922029-Rhodomonas_salina.2